MAVEMYKQVTALLEYFNCFQKSYIIHGVLISSSPVIAITQVM